MVRLSSPCTRCCVDIGEPLCLYPVASQVLLLLRLPAQSTPTVERVVQTACLGVAVLG